MPGNGIIRLAGNGSRHWIGQREAVKVRGGTMITAEEIRRLQLQEPFSPFTIHMSDGRHFEILYPELILVARNSVTVGLPGNAPIPDRTEICSILHITSVQRVGA